MRYWDSSALVALHVQQGASVLVRALYGEDPQVLTWILSDVEMRSAIVRLLREEALTQVQAQDTVRRIETFWSSVHAVDLIDAVKVRAKRILGVHSLKAADALQLGAAVVATYDDPLGWEFVCLDDRLAGAARKEGFAVLP